MKARRAAFWIAGVILGLGVVAALAPEPETPDSASTAATAAAGDPDSAEDIRDLMQPIGGQGQIFAFAIPTGSSAADVEAAARSQCAELAFCQVYGWQDAAQLPGAWPMLDREVAALSFRYALNRNSGYEDATWYCGSLGAKPDCTKADAN